MAEEKDFMESQDFLGDLFENVGKSTGKNLFEKLSTNARQDAIQPLVKSLQVQAFTKPLRDLANKAKKAQRAGMAAYIAANPEIDESLLFDGTGDIISGVMQENNLRFREINRQLSFMDVTNPRYQELANELNKINKTSAQLREDNTKLLNIRNIMTDDNRVEELTDGMTQGQQDMYNDILTGNTENFVNINGKLHWQNPNDADEDPIAISSIDAGGPMYTNSLVVQEHVKLYSQVINATYVDDVVLQNKIKNIWGMDGVGDAGLKSFIFDSVDNDELTSFNTSEWFDSWFEENNIVGEEAQEAERERIRRQGVTADGATGTVKQHFSAWYHKKLKESLGTQYDALNTESEEGGSGTGGGTTEEKIVPKKKPTPLPTGDLDKKLLPKLNDDAVYEDQTGTGDQFGIAKSPFAGITQFGWNVTTDPKGREMSSNDHLFEFGDDDYVINTLNREYSKYGFEFTEAGSDELRVRYKGEDLGTFEFDKLASDKPEAKRLQLAMHIAAGIPTGEEKEDLPLNVNTTQQNTPVDTQVNTQTDAPVLNTQEEVQETTGTLLSQNLNDQQQQIVKTISIDGTTGANRADILVNGNKVQAKVMGGAVKVIGVRAEGNRIVADAKPMIGSQQSQDIGEFKLNSDGTASFTPNEDVYKQLKGEEKALFDTMVLAMKTDPEYVKQVLGAVQGTTRFDSKNY